MVRTLNLFAVTRFGLPGLAKGLLTPLCPILLLSAALAQDPITQSVRLPQAPDIPATTPALSLAGSLAHIASAGGWESALTLVNVGTTTGQARLNFFANDGTALPLPYTLPQQPASGTKVASTIDQTLDPNAVLVLDTTGPITQALAVGSSQLLTTGNISGFGVFKYTPTGQEAVVPLEVRNADSYVLAFDNTGALVTGLAIANLASAAANIAVVIRDDTGKQIGTGTIHLPPQGHNSFVLTDHTLGFPVTAGKRGTVEFDTPQGGRISVLGLRASGNALTSLPVLANVGNTGGAMAHVASGGGWQTIFTLVNTGATSANVTLSFSADNGTALTLPLSFPQSQSSGPRSSVTQAIPAGATLIIVTQGQSSAGVVTGSAQLSTTGNVSGFAIFQYGGQEAVVPLETGNASSYTLAFDNTSGLVTGVALANSSAQPAVVPATLRDSTGATLASTTINLPANAHKSQILTGLFSQAANIRGTIEFATPENGQIRALGIRATPAGAFTTIPVMTPVPSDSVVAQRELAQTGLAIGLASTVLQSQITVLDALLGEATSCVALNGGGSVISGSPDGTVMLYYDTHCSRLYIEAHANGSGGATGDGEQVIISETATYHAPNGTSIGTLSLKETALISNAEAVNVFGLGIFTPASGAHTPVQLGLYCGFASLTATTVQCGGGVAQDFPALGLAVGAVTPLTLKLAAPAPLLHIGAPTTGGVTFTGGGSAFTGPIGSLTLTNPSPTSLAIKGGTAYASTTSSGGAAAFSLFPPTPTSWTLTDSAHDQQFQVSVVDNTVRNLTLTILQLSTGGAIATGVLDQSGSGTITYSDGSTAAITNWTLAN